GRSARTTGNCTGRAFGGCRRRAFRGSSIARIGGHWRGSVAARTGGSARRHWCSGRSRCASGGRRRGTVATTRQHKTTKSRQAAKSYPAHGNALSSQDKPAFSQCRLLHVGRRLSRKVVRIV